MQVGGDVMTEQCEECGDGERFVAVAHDIEVDSMSVVVETEPGHCRIYGHHEENADDAAVRETTSSAYVFDVGSAEGAGGGGSILSLLPRLAVVCRMAHDEN